MQNHNTNTDIIYKRKSIRKYEQTPLDKAALDALQAKIATLTPLHAQIKYTVSLTSKTKGMFGVTAPHYLVFRSENTPAAYENIGFVGQQIGLYLAENNIGSCWLGMAKPANTPEDALPFVLCMAFGNAAEPLCRQPGEFKRKALTEISSGSDERLPLARLAPSGMNAQGWYFIAAGGKIHCYRKKTLFAGERLSCIDMGIALYHICLASESFSYTQDKTAPAHKGFTYSGTVG